MTGLDGIADRLAEAHRDPAASLAASDLASLTRAEALAVQNKVLSRLGGVCEVVKVATPPGSVAIGSPIPPALVLRDGETVPSGGRPFEGIEFEVALRLKRDLTPEIAAQGRDAVLACVDYFVLGIEPIASRLDDRHKASPGGLLADFMFTGGYIIGGDPLDAAPDVTGLAVTMTVDGVVTRTEPLRYPFGDALAPVMAFVLQNEASFGGLRKGMLVTTGSLTPLLPAPTAGLVTMTLGQFGSVSYRAG